MPTTIELARIAAAVNLLRPDWPTKSLQTLLERDHASRPYHDLAVAAVWIATDPDTKTPARLNEPGPWWQALTTTTTPRLQRHDHDQWAAEHADATPPPADFRALVEEHRPAPVEQVQPARPVNDPGRLAEVRAELEQARVGLKERVPSAGGGVG